LNVLKERAEPVRQMVTTYATNLNSRLHELLQSYEKKSCYCPLCKFRPKFECCLSQKTSS
jgi:hypothetical protein